MQSAIDTTYKTKDFYITAYLVSRGLHIRRIDRTNPRQVYFTFEDSSHREQLVDDFLYGNALVEPKSFISSIKEVKQLLHSNDK